jgi:hypothetical protein
VREIRERYRLGRSELAVMCGYPKTGVRIGNIELRESWKEGDRQRVYDILTALLAGTPPDKRVRQRSETGVKRPERTDSTPPQRTAPVATGPGPVLLSDDDVDVEPTLIPDVDDELPEFSITRGGIQFPATDDGVKDLTNSEVGVWNRCKRKWWLGVYRQLTLKTRDYMGLAAVGGRVHRAFAAWYVPDGQERTDPREALERAIVEDWTAIVAQERQRPSYIDDDASLGDLSTRFHSAVSLERAMVEGYVEWIIERGDDAQLRITAPETEVNALIEGDVADEHVVFRARALLDVRMTRVADGTRLFADHKTVGNFAQKRKTLHMNPQMLHYHLLEWLNTEEGGARCDGALYNMIRRVKRGPTAKPPFYERVEVHHNAYEIDAYRRRLLGAARDIMRTERELNAGADPMSVCYPNPTDACSFDCDFFAICHMFDDGSRVDDAITGLYQIQDPMARYDQVRTEEGI